MAKWIPPRGVVMDVHPATGKHFSLQELQQYVGGYVQAVTLPDGRQMMVDEDGKTATPPRARNAIATQLLSEAGGMPSDHVVGNALIVDPGELSHGDDEEEGGDDAA